ncbi:hypothetical protein L9F63_001847, partial [Diploptera punctata]
APFPLPKTNSHFSPSLSAPNHFANNRIARRDGPLKSTVFVSSLPAYQRTGV